MCICLYVAGESGSADTVRDPRGFAVKFYTDEGNWDLTGNNTPIFFIRDALLVRDSIHMNPLSALSQYLLKMCVNCVCSFRPSSTLRSGIRRLTWRIRIWFGISGVCVLNRCTRYTWSLLCSHVNAESLAHFDLRVCAGVFPVQRSGNSGWPPSYERIRIAHFQTGQRSGRAGVLQIPLQGTYCL